jgi:hypothetical protein
MSSSLHSQPDLNPAKSCQHTRGHSDQGTSAFILTSTILQSVTFDDHSRSFMVAEDSMEEEVQGDARSNEVRSGFTPPHLYGLRGVSKEQNQGTNHDVSLGTS